jgi:uncharacterized SAM-binding protein YcdF (DUF218 family)
MMDGFEIKVFVRSLLAPPALPWLLIVIGWLVCALPWRAGRRGATDREARQARARRQRQGLAIMALGLVLAYLSSIGVVGSLLTSALESGLQRWDPALQARRPAQAVVILGGGTHRWSAPAVPEEHLRAATLQRVFEGARIARASGLPVLVSGGVPSGHERSEAQIMSEVLRQGFGLSVRWLEDQSRDTADNAVMSARLLQAQGVRHVILVTHAYHMPRAQRAFESAGLDVTVAPHDFLGRSLAHWRWRDFVPDASEAERIRRCLHEFMGIAWYAIRGRL